jgi:hypothetical protein
MATEMIVSLQEFLSVVSATWFFVLPPTLWFLFRFLWMKHVQGIFVGKIEFVLLEVIPPQNIEKSPQPMESLYSGMSGALKTPNIYEKFLDGYITAYFSLEIVGRGGDGVHLYIRTPKRMRSLVEAHLYAQYPDVELIEVPDYVDEVPKVIPNAEWKLWGSDFELTDPDPIPIKTYRYFEEDVTGKMIDPMAGLIEIMGQLPPGQHLWLQFVIMPIPERWTREVGLPFVQEKIGRSSPKKVSALKTFFDEMLDIVRNIPKALLSTPEFATKKEEKKDEQPLEFRLTPMEKKALEALESNIGKNVFSTKMRMVYIGKHEGFDKATFISGFIGGIKQFADMNSNSFKTDSWSKTEDSFYVFRQTLYDKLQRKIFRRYKDRDMDGKTFVLSTEELATVFHLPDMAVVSPFLRRVAAKRGSAPSNLPF